MKEKRHLYKTAQATISCSRFKKGAFVNVAYDGIGGGGVHYFKVFWNHEDWEAKNRNFVIYPEHHLTRFVL